MADLWESGASSCGINKIKSPLGPPGRPFFFFFPGPASQKKIFFFGLTHHMIDPRTLFENCTLPFTSSKKMEKKNSPWGKGLKFILFCKLSKAKSKVARLSAGEHGDTKMYRRNGIDKHIVYN